MRIGRKLIHLESVDSTNNYVANMVKSDGLASGTVILADDQFNGKGQRGAEWVSSAGNNLTLSIYLDDVNLSVDRQFNITKVISIGIHQFLKKNGIISKIKWPNDAVVGNTKIAGILIENHISATSIKSSIIGIGINVNQLDFNGISATSMSKETGQLYTLSETYFSFIYTINEIWDRLFEDHSKLNHEYLQTLYRLNEVCAYSDVNGTFDGEIVGISSFGKLKVSRDGGIVEYSLKEIKFL